MRKVKKPTTPYARIILISSTVLICLIFLGKYLYATLTFSSSLADTIKTEVQVFPAQALPGDTVRYVISVTYWGDHALFQDASLLYEVDGVSFIPNSLKVRKGSLSPSMVRFPENENHFWLNEINWSEQATNVSRKLLSFSLKGVISTDPAEANREYPCQISAITDDFAIKLKNATENEGLLSVQYAPFEVKSRIVAGRPKPGHILTYETTVIAEEDAELGLKQIQLIDVFNSSYIDIIPTSVRIFTKRGFTKPEVAQNSLYIDKLDIEAGEEVTVTYKIIISESAPPSVNIQNVATAFIPDTQISHSNSATIELAMLSILSIR